MSRHFIPCAFLAMAALALPACGGREPRLAVHPASGQVVLKGEPVPKALVRFHPADPATVRYPAGEEGPPIFPTTETDAQGRFSLSTYLADDGVPAGSYAVTVAAGASDEEVEGSDAPPRKARRQGPTPGEIYRDPSTTPLKATVKPGENTFVLELN